MGSMILESGFQVDKGRNEGFLCHRCSWSGRSISTRLMSLAELRKHAATEHRVPSQCIDEFVSKAPHETRGEWKGNFFGDQTTGNQNTEDTFRRIQPLNRKPRGKLQDLFPDVIMASRLGQQPATTSESHGPGYAPAIKNPLQSLCQQPMDQEYSLVGYPRHLSNFTSQPGITGSQENTILASSSTNKQTRKPHLSRAQVRDSVTMDLDTDPEKGVGVTGHPWSMRLPDRSSTNHGVMSESVQDKDNGEVDSCAAVLEGEGRPTSRIVNSTYSAIDSPVNLESTFHSSNRNRNANRREDNNAGSQPKHNRTFNSKHTPSFSSIPGFRQNLQDCRTASLGLTAQSANSQPIPQERAYKFKTQPSGSSQADILQGPQNSQAVGPSLEIQTGTISAILPKSKDANNFKDSPSDYTQSNGSGSQQQHQIVSSPHTVDRADHNRPDRTSSSVPNPNHFTMDKPDNVLGTPFGSTRNVARPKSDEGKKKKRKFSDEPIPRPTSRRQTERPVLAINKPSELDTAFCSADEVPPRTEALYRQWLTDYAPDVPHRDLTYERFKADFDSSKDKRIFVHLASERFLKERRRRLNEYEQITMNPYILIDNLSPSEQINYVNAHRAELVSLMAQRAFQELAAEDKLDDEQDIENTRIDLERNRGNPMPGRGPDQIVALHGESLDIKPIPGLYQVLLPHGEIFDHTAEGAMPDRWEDGFKLLSNDSGGIGVFISDNELPQDDPQDDTQDDSHDDQFFDFDAASAPWR